MHLREENVRMRIMIESLYRQSKKSPDSTLIGVWLVLCGGWVKDQVTGRQCVPYHVFCTRVVGIICIKENYFISHFSTGNRYPMTVINTTWDID
jgi:hypothetical protein